MRTFVDAFYDLTPRGYAALAIAEQQERGRVWHLAHRPAGCLCATCLAAWYDYGRPGRVMSAVTAHRGGGRP